MKAIDSVDLFIGFLYFNVIVILIVIIYFNVVWGMHLTKAKKVILTNANGSCILDTNLEVIELINGIYYYLGIPFVTGEDESDAENYLQVCSYYEEGSELYKICNDKLKPPSGCTNKSKPLGRSDEGDVYYALYVKGSKQRL